MEMKVRALRPPAGSYFLFGARGTGKSSFVRDFYVRQLRDVKIKLPVETFEAARMNIFAQCCGYTLALSHARSGDPALISGYLGKSDTFDEALAAFSVAYADQNEQDHAVLKRAISDGNVKAVFEEVK